MVYIDTDGLAKEVKGFRTLLPLANSRRLKTTEWKMDLTAEGGRIYVNHARFYSVDVLESFGYVPSVNRR